MTSRREFLRQGMSAFALGLWTRGLPFPISEPPCPDTGALPLLQSAPFVPVPPLPQSVLVDGLPFMPGWTGDHFSHWDQIPFHHQENNFPGNQPPAPTEEVPLVIVGGGLSGLATAYMLREHRPVVFELHNRFGGVSQGEEWSGIRYSLGGAYFIAPDEGDFLEAFYRELGLDHAHRLDDGPGSAELLGRIIDDFWSGRHLPQQDRIAFERYAALVSLMANETYPDIPLPAGKNNQWILDLDRRSLKDDITQRLGVPVPTLLASAIQSYCYSSFGAGWEELSAASGWNFIAAEEFGRWVCPGGNAHVIQVLWDRLSRLERPSPPSCPGRLLRAGCRVVDVRLVPNNRVQVTYRDRTGTWRSLLARKAVICCSKHIAKHIIRDLRTLDEPKVEAMWDVETRAYIVANVLLNTRIRRDFYDIFLLGNGQYPTNDQEAHAWWHITDVVDGDFARPNGPPHADVLSIYWPLPAFDSRVRVVLDEAWTQHTQRIAPQIRALLAAFGVHPDHIRQIRLTRWGHAMPIARPGFIADGKTEHLRRPVEDRIYFVNQDNWLLPAFETCLLEANHYAPAIAQGL